MSMSPTLPAVLQIPCKQPAGMGYQSNSLSIERVLNNAHKLIMAYQATLPEYDTGYHECGVTLDDLEEMLARIDR